jgi:flagellar basal body-associated protein FliL
VAVIVAVAMIMVVAMVVMTFGGEKHREQEHQAGDEGRSPGIA